jgi:serine/threonine-protein kinase
LQVLVHSSDSDIRFGKIAVSRGMVGKAHVEEGLRALRGGGTLAKDLPAWLSEKKYLTPVQADMVLGEMQSSDPNREILGNYEILDLAGKGGMGKVYRARQITMDRIVALKILNPDRTANDAFRKRFIREARAAAALNHPNIVRAIDAGEVNGVLFFAMEYIEAENVAQILRRQGPLDEPRAMDIILQMAHALAHASRQGLVHRDVKPENILIDLGGVAKLTDMGLAKSTDADGECITQTGRAMGTPYYISPEQIQLVADLDVRVDIYSLGASFYHMLTGTPPFYAESPAAIVSMHLTEDFVSPRVHKPALSEGVCTVVARMMEKDRARRYQTAEELIEALEKLKYGASVSSGGEIQAYVAAPQPHSPFADPGIAPPPPPEKGRAGMGTLVAVVVLGAIALGVFIVILAGGDDEKEDSQTHWVDKDKGGDNGREGGSEVKKTAPPRPTRPDSIQGPRAPSGEKEYEELRRFLDENKAAFKEGLRRLDELLEAFPKGSVAVMARRDHQTLKARLDVEAGKTLKALRRKASELSRLERFGEAMAVYDHFPDDLALGIWPRKVKRLKGLLREKGRMAVEKVLADAETYSSDGRFIEAQNALERAAEFGLAGLEGEIARRLEKVKLSRAGWVEEEFLRGFFRATSSRDILSAEEFLARWQSDKKTVEIGPLLREASQRLSRIRAFIARRDEVLGGRKGKNVDFMLKNGRVVAGRFVDVTDGKGEVSLSSSARVVTTFAVADLGVATLHRLLTFKGVAGWLDIAAFELLYLGDFEAARQAMARAWKEGEDGGAFLKMFDDLEKERVERIITTVEKNLDRNPPKSQTFLTALLETHRAAACFADLEGRVGAALRKLSRTGRGPFSNLDCHARVLPIKGGRIKTVYDFNTTCQIRDWSIISGRFYVEDGVLHQTVPWKEGEGRKPEIALAGKWENFTVEAEFRVPWHARWTGIVFHDTGGGKRIVFQMIHTRRKPAANRLYVGFFVPEKGEGGRIVFDGGQPVHGATDNMLYTPTGPFDPARYHRLKVRVFKKKASGFFDGKPVATVDLADFSPGRLSLRMAGRGFCNFVTIVTGGTNR